MAEFLESLMIFRKSLVVGLLSVTALMVGALPGMARPATITYEANIRSGPSMQTTRLDGLPKDTPIEVLKIVDDADSDGRGLYWYYVRSTGKLRTEGWVTSTLVRFNASSQNYGTLAGEPGDVINIRSDPSTQRDVLHTGVLGDLVMVGRSARSSDGGYPWYYVTYPNGAAGWVRADLISVWPKGCIITCPDV
jgi:hypothetical protein